ncbi:MAG: hypothetical protein V4504_02135 [Patescibacteria group bacterium]
MTKISEVLGFLQNPMSGTFVSYENKDENQTGHSSSFTIKCKSDANHLSIEFMSPEDLEKHVKFLQKEEECFLTIIKIGKTKESLKVDLLELIINLKCKYKSFENNILLITVQNCWVNQIEVQKD